MQVCQQLMTVYNTSDEPLPLSSAHSSTSAFSSSKLRRSEHSRLHEAVKAIALCHNVTPAYDTTEQ